VAPGFEIASLAQSSFDSSAASLKRRWSSRPEYNIHKVTLLNLTKETKEEEEKKLNMDSTTCQTNEKKKWTNEAVRCLIEAYKQEPCLYAVDMPNYRNKNIRNKALQKVCATVSLVRPGTMENECSTKFRSLRNQFNIENTKMKASIKSGTDTDVRMEI